MMRKFLSIVAMATLLSGASFAEEYALTGKPSLQRDDGKIEVLEFFWFGCPHCYAFEPVLEDWAAELPEDVVFRREAPDLNSSWKAHSQAFYAGELMEVSDIIVKPIFDAIHKDKKPLRSIEAVADFVETLGVDKAKFLSTAKSFAVAGRIAQARKLAMNYGLTGVPAVIVNGKYRTTGSLSGSHDNWVSVIDRLIETERDGA